MRNKKQKNKIGTIVFKNASFAVSLRPDKIDDYSPKKTSRVVFENRNYIVCETRAGLTSQNKRSGYGSLLPVDSNDYEQWIEAFATAMDDIEKNDLARALYLNKGEK
jgi:hypothetical protein